MSSLFRIAPSLGLGALFFSLFPPVLQAAESLDVEVSLNQSIFELGQETTITISGPPGAGACLVFGTVKGEFVIDGIATLGFDSAGSISAVDLPSMPASGEMEIDFTSSCDNLELANGPVFMQVLLFPLGNPLPACASEVISLIWANGECERCLADNTTDPSLSIQPDGFVFDAPGLGGQFRFTGASSIEERADGTATLTGFLENVGNPGRRLGLQMELAGRLDCLDAAFPPSGAPDLKLLPSAFFGNGGTIDPQTWHYYTTGEGSLAGFGDAFGAAVRLDLNGALQLGRGADGRTADFGVCGSFTSSIEAQPEDGQVVLVGGDNLNFVAGQSECPATNVDKCVTEGSPDNHAFYIRDYPGSRQWDFVDGPGRWREFTDGTAQLEGRIANVDDATCCFDVLIRFDEVFFPGQFGYPPAGSPTLSGLPDGLLQENGGPVDPGLFYYYTETEGVMFGCEAYEGAVVRIDRRGTAQQVGNGANLNDEDFGTSGWLGLHRLVEPNGEKELPLYSDGDNNVDLPNCPNFQMLPVLAYGFSSLGGNSVYDGGGEFELVFNEADGEIDWVLEGTTTGLDFEQQSGGDSSLIRPSGTDTSYLLEKLQESNAMTVQAFFRQSDLQENFARIVTFSSSDSLQDRNFSLIGTMNNGNGTARVRLATNQGVVNESVDASWDAEDPVVLAFTYDQVGDGFLKVYLNGEEVDRFEVDGDFEGWPEREFLVGNEVGGGDPLDGRLYDLRIWNRELTPEELLEESSALQAGL